MTAQKPPDKTLVGMPADLKAVLEKLDQATADKSVFSDPPRRSAFDPSQARAGNRPRSVPPPLPKGQGAPAPLSTPRAANPGPQDSASAAPMDRTLIGMPSNMQEALARAIAEQANAQEVAPPNAATPRPAPAAAPAAVPRRQPSAAGPVLRAQPVRAVGVPSTPASEAQVPVYAGRGPVPSPKPTAAAAYRAVPPRAAPTYASGLGYEPSRSAADQAHGEPAGMKVLAPQAPLDWPPAARRSEPSLAPVRVHDEPDADSTLGTEPTQLALNVEIPLGSSSDASGAASVPGPGLAWPPSTDDDVEEKYRRAGQPKKRWITSALAALGVVVLAVVGARLLPSLLEASLGSEPDTANATAPAAANPPTLPVAPATLTTDTAAATDPGRFTPTPTRPPAAPAMTSGVSAQLEKRAIEHLIANDYPAAKQLYEKLQSAESTRPEFALMVELLSRASARACGEPGQAPCAGAQP